MSASITFHGPLSASARLIPPSGGHVKEPFVTVDIATSGASIALVSVSADDLEALSAALGEARAQLAAIAGPPEYEPDDGEAQRIAEVYADARAELDRGL